MTIMEYAHKILADHNCQDDCYKGSYAKYAIPDLMEAYPEGMEFPYEEVAQAIVDIGNAVPDPPPAPYRMIWDNGDSVDGIDCKSLENAKEVAFEVYCGWMEGFEGTQEDWDMMIWNCHCYITKWIPEEERSDYREDDVENGYVDYAYLDDDELKKIGWVLSEDMDDETLKQYKELMWKE